MTPDEERKEMTCEEVIKQLNIQIAQREKSGINSTQAVEDVCIETAWELDRLRAELAEAKGERENAVAFGYEGGYFQGMRFKGEHPEVSPTGNPMTKQEAIATFLASLRKSQEDKT